MTTPMDENKEKAKELLVQYRRKLANIEAGFEGFGPWSDTSYDNFETLAHIIARSPEVGNNIHNMDSAPICYLSPTSLMRRSWTPVPAYLTA